MNMVGMKIMNDQFLGLPKYIDITVKLYGFVQGWWARSFNSRGPYWIMVGETYGEHNTEEGDADVGFA